MEISKFCDTCIKRMSARCKEKGYVPDMQEIQPECYFNGPSRECEYMVRNSETTYDCERCKEIYGFRYEFCCLEECGQQEFCRGCDKGIYSKNKVSNNTK